MNLYGLAVTEWPLFEATIDPDKKAATCPKPPNDPLPAGDIWRLVSTHVIEKVEVSQRTGFTRITTSMVVGTGSGRRNDDLRRLAR